ncbi:MAG: hypothetical protein Terrestrivirus3_199 [Terrestrivirus sp.]|uniref:Uncharacterized protein n=1 Tax=Terrestrivirus sp. TaxID=2487775 RepID=A0A3G4ZM44_9VIRU|nr:MAG: hypothetical protein Terrestrivirus3_199 [Terrestrivirus sp.]
MYINNLKNIIANGSNCKRDSRFELSSPFSNKYDTSNNSDPSIKAIKQKYGYGYEYENSPEHESLNNHSINSIHPENPLPIVPIQGSMPVPVPVPVPVPGPRPTPFPMPGEYPLNLRNLVREYDAETLVNPFVAPTSRPPGYFFGPTLVNPLFNFPTQGIPDDYSYVGNLVETDLLHDKDKNKNIKIMGEEAGEAEQIKNNLHTNTSLLQLIGRQRYPNGNRYDYYALVPSGLGHIKVEVRSHRNHELYDGDEVEISELGHKKYTFKKNPSYWNQYH